MHIHNIYLEYIYTCGIISYIIEIILIYNNNKCIDNTTKYIYTNRI